MSNLTANDTRGLMEAYAAVYAPQEETLEQEIFETIAYALISQGYTATDVLEYFANVDDEVIIEDLVALSEGTLLIESVVSEEYIEEQFQQLDEVIGLLARGAMALARPVAGLVARGATKVAQKAANVVGKLTPKKALPPAGATGAGAKNFAAPVANPNLLQRAGSALSGAVQNVKGAATKVLDKLPGGSQGKLAGLVKGGAKLALGGAAFEAGMRGAGALMGNKGPTAKPAPAAPSLKAKQDYAKSKGKYYSSSDQKTYANYNDALAARNSRLGKPAPTPPKTPSSTPSSSTPSTPSTPKPAKPATAKLGNTSYEVRTPTSAELKGAQEYRAANPNAKPEDVLKAAQLRGKQQASVDADIAKFNKPEELNKPAPAGTALAAEEERRRKVAAEKAAAGTTKESYDAYDIVLEYLISGGHVESISEAHYVMLEMDSQTIRNIVEETTTEKLARRASEKADEPGAKSEYKPEGPGFKHPRSKASIMNQIAGRAKNREQHGVDSQYASQSEQPRRGGRKGRGSRTDRPATANMPNPNRRPK